jgi:fluoride ion exporter CrcB/FEX
MTVLLVIVGGGVGAIARFLVDGVVESLATSRRRESDFPLGTFSST